MEKEDFLFILSEEIRRIGKIAFSEEIRRKRCKGHELYILLKLSLCSIYSIFIYTKTLHSQIINE